LNGKSPYDKLVMLKTVSTSPTTENRHRQTPLAAVFYCGMKAVLDQSGAAFVFS